MGEVFGMRRVGHVDQRGAVELGLPGQRIYRLLRVGDAAVMADIGDPAAGLLMHQRLIGAARLQVAVADQRHVAGLRLLLSEGRAARGGEAEREEDRGVADHDILPAPVFGLSFPRKRESRAPFEALGLWIPAFAGMTTIGAISGSSRRPATPPDNPGRAPR